MGLSLTRPLVNLHQINQVRSSYCTVTYRTGDFFSHFASKSYQNMYMSHNSVISKYFARMTWLILIAMWADGHCHLFCSQSLVFLWCWLKWLACCSVVCIGIILHFAAQRSIKNGSLEWICVASVGSFSKLTEFF